MADERLYILTFASGRIGRSVRPQIHQNGGWGRALPPAVFRRFAAERVIGSSWTQKTLSRALKELSNGIKYDAFNLKINELLAN